MRAALLVVAVLACLAFASAKVTAKVNKQVANFKASTKSQKAHVGGSEISSVRNDKKVLHKAFAQNGVKNVKTKALLLSMFGAETSNNMYNKRGIANNDAAKNGAATNVSPLNMNVAMVKKIGYKGNPRDLQKKSKLSTVVGIAVKGMNKFGVQGFMNFQRGGETGYNNPKSNQFLTKQYKNGIYNTMQKYLKDKKLMKDGRKVWAQIPYV